MTLPRIIREAIAEHQREGEILRDQLARRNAAIVAEYDALAAERLAQFDAEI